MTQPPLPPPPIPPPGAFPPPGKPSSAKAVLATLAVVAGLAVLGVGGFVGYKLLTRDHCGSVANAATSFVEDAMSTEADLTLEAYLQRFRETTTPRYYPRLADQAGAVFRIRESNPTYRGAATKSQVVNESVTECSKTTAVVKLTISSTTTGPNLPSGTVTRSVNRMELAWQNGKWLVDGFAAS
ncbi:MAG: hypothetical protein QM728_01010 [Gordonia sp. (in: high G+C Gram-positive bacteria)]|uniref:hypothetical protein n=1 Tax=Gordonia sp. (in: high G+C Gram-positive bacteria) TaxID=84139 RepID=UPI0039E2F569